LLAQKGFEGPRQILEAEDGGFLAATSDEVRRDEIERDLGRVWRTDGVCFKPYACCGSNHASIDAALDMMAEHRFTASDVRRVKVGIGRVVERQTGFPYRPSTVLNAQMSLRFNVAVALVDGTALVDQFTEERIVDPVVCDLASRVDVEVDPEMDAVYPERYAGVVTLVLDEGRHLRKRVDYSKGMPENRMTSTDLDAKFLSLAGAAVGAKAAGDLLERMAGIFDASNISGLTRHLGTLRLNQPDYHGGHGGH
jgi:2-methylcitrate dehydratase PrpD